MHRDTQRSGEDGRAGSKNRCTDLCVKLSELPLVSGKLPTHAELVAGLGFQEQDLEAGIFLGTVAEIQQRRSCPFCQLVLAATGETDEHSQTPSDIPIRAIVFPDEQSFRLSYPSRLGTQLAFVADNDGEISGPDSARLVRGNNVEPSLVLSWLSKCEEHHGAECYPLLEYKQAASEPQVRRPISSRTPFDFEERMTSNFRVIDLELECVVPQMLDARYVALSYVWGQLPMFRLLKSNVEQLSQQGGLREVIRQLPRTILDAVEFVKALGIRFLWVDALCLIQDDENDIEIGMEIMNSVYRGSYFTIIAASGYDATAGLPGAMPDSRLAAQTIVKLAESDNALRMTVQHSIDWHLKRSVYSERGWTLQELVLPRRTIIFINNQVYFRCNKANWSEETTADAFTHYLDPDDSNVSRIPDLLDGGVPSWWAYQKLFEEYSSREIRFEGDALRATAGILRPLCAGMETLMLEGLPANYLDNALLFTSSSGNLRRRPNFASFSWAGWSGSVMWPRENYVWYDVDGKRTWDTSNLFRWFAGKTFINWSYLAPDASQQDLMHDPYKAPCRLGVLVQDISRKYPQFAEQLGAFEARRLTRHAFPYSRGGGSGPFYATWDLSSRKRATSQASLNLANSRAEFDRMLRSIDPLDFPLELLSLMNWMACRRGQVRRVVKGSKTAPESEDARKTFPTPRSIGFDEDRVHYRFRHNDELTRPREDKRVKAAKREIARGTIPDMAIPKFPPYAVLYFETVSISLVLGQQPGVPVNAPLPGRSSPSFHRVPGIPILSPSSEMVGSLHPDNMELLPPPGSDIECILMSHCHALTWSSALEPREDPISKPFPQDSKQAEHEKQWDLFWALYIVWKDGIAERRGVAQLLSTAVGKSCDPGPMVKEIILG